MRKLLTISATLLLLSGCNTIDGFGKDLGAIGQAFAGMFDSSVQNSRRIRDNSDFIANGPGGGIPPVQQQQQQSYGGSYGGGQTGGYGGQTGAGNYGGGQNTGAMPPQFPPYYQQQPRQPAMPYYYNEGY